jgi:septum formation topological specificity factor MinE
MQRQYSIAKQKMRNMNFTIIEKFSDLIDINKVRSNHSSYVDFPNEFTLITPAMVENFAIYGETVYFGVYPEYISQSKKLLLVGGFYGIDQHHRFVPFATVILTLVKKEEEVIVFSNLLDIIDKEDDDIVKTLMSIFRTFFSYYNAKVERSRLLLVVRQTNNMQAAIYEMRKEFPNLNFIYCFREKLNSLELEVNKRYCNDSYSSEEKLDFITALYSMVKTLEEEEYAYHLKNLFKKANTNNTLLLQKITEDCHLFCFSKVKDPSNNLYEQCIDDYLRRKYTALVNNEVKSKHQFMRNIMAIINDLVASERDTLRVKQLEFKPSVGQQ